jgi:uncharacterized protein (DUF433 family)
MLEGTKTLAAIGLDRITFNPRVMGGRACIRGMRLTVSLIVNLVADGMTPAEIIKVYPELEPEDVQQALSYAAWLATDAVHPLDIPAE